MSTKERVEALAEKVLQSREPPEGLVTEIEALAGKLEDSARAIALRARTAAQAWKEGREGYELDHRTATYAFLSALVQVLDE